MSSGKRILDIGNMIFWIILLIIALMLLPFFKEEFYNDEHIDEWIAQFDTLSPQPNPEPDPSNDTIPGLEEDTMILHWRDFDGHWPYIKFTYPKAALDNAESNRLNGSANYSIYNHLYSNDKAYLANLIEKMKKDIQRRNLNYMKAVEYVCSSIQFIPYTLILDSSGECPCREPFGTFTANCKVQEDGRGCCANISPFGVYSPFEFLYYKTGDCDTRSLTAFTILKELGFDVAVMVSESEGHSVLGVVIPGRMNSDLSMGVNAFGKPYLLWELTNADWRLGDQVGGDDWVAELE